jgi:hypothetical protein
MIHHNHCEHPKEDFIESHAGCDIHVYKCITGETHYCVRYGSEGGDYYSSVRTLEDARRKAEHAAARGYYND